MELLNAGRVMAASRIDATERAKRGREQRESLHRDTPTCTDSAESKVTESFGQDVDSAEAQVTRIIDRLAGKRYRGGRIEFMSDHSESTAEEHECYRRSDEWYSSTPSPCHSWHSEQRKPKQKSPED